MLEITETAPAQDSPPVARRRSALREVEGAVCRDRQATHGDAEDNFAAIATIWNVQLANKLREPITAIDVALLMVGLKLGRAAQNPEVRDHYVDAAGYAVCGAGILESTKA